MLYIAVNLNKCQSFDHNLIVCNEPIIVNFIVFNFNAILWHWNKMITNAIYLKTYFAPNPSRN